MHIYTSTYVHAYTHSCMHTCMHAYTHIYIHAYIHIKNYIYTWLLMPLSNKEGWLTGSTELALFFFKAAMIPIGKIWNLPAGTRGNHGYKDFTRVRDGLGNEGLPWLSGRERERDIVGVIPLLISSMICTDASWPGSAASFAVLVVVRITAAAARVLSTVTVCWVLWEIRVEVPCDGPASGDI